MIAAVTLPAVVGLFVLQVLTAVLRREPGGLSRAVVGVGKAMLGSGIAIAVTQTALLACDQICGFIAASAGTTVTGAASRFLQLTWLAGPQSGPVLQVLLGLGLIVALLLLWGVLLFRKAALLLVAVFAPIAFAGAVWEHSRVWTRKWIEIVAALVFCKVVIVVVFVVGASAFAGSGPTTLSGSPGATTPTASLSDLLVGLLLLTIAMFAPWLTWRFVHWSGMEAASVMHGAMAANPVSGAMRSSGSQAKFMAQSAVTSMLLGGAGGAVGASGRGVRSTSSPGPGGPGASATRLVSPSTAATDKSGQAGTQRATAGAAAGPVRGPRGADVGGRP